MRLYEQRNDKDTIQCSYCFETGHNKRYCPTMKAQWDANPQVHETYDHDSLVEIDKTMFPNGYQTYYGDEQAKNQFRGHWEYMQNRYAPKAETNKARKATKCGFCGEEGHTRRNCESMKNFVYVLEQTNREYRSQFYDRYIEGMGLGAGALVQMRTGNETESIVGLVTGFNPNDIVFTNLKSRWSDYHSKVKMTYMVDGQQWTREFSSLIYDKDYYDNHKEHGVWSEFYSHWGSLRGVLSPAPNRPSKEWFMGQAPCFNWIVKKRDQGTLISTLSELINEFYVHDDLKERLGESVYDTYFKRYDGR